MQILEMNKIFTRRVKAKVQALLLSDNWKRMKSNKSILSRDSHQTKKKSKKRPVKSPKRMIKTHLK